jgi:hypothetical protein
VTLGLGPMAPIGAPVISVSRDRTVISDDAPVLGRLQDGFAAHRCVRLERVLESSLLALVQARVRAGSFFEFVHPSSGRELCMDEDGIVDLLRFLFNTPEVFALIERITGCDPIRLFVCRIYVFRPNEPDIHDWHSDVDMRRMVGFSLNLSEGIFEGGELEMRRRSDQQVFLSVANQGQSDALIFSIDSAFEHRVRPVTGGVRKIALAGWFLGHETPASAA